MDISKLFAGGVNATIKSDSIIEIKEMINNSLFLINSCNFITPYP